MKIALVHDYINEFGGAERVLKTLTEIYPNAPIYTAFRVKGSTADIELRQLKEIGDRKIIESFLAPLLKIGKLYSPLRFLIPVIWGSFDLMEYDLIISVTSEAAKGIITRPGTLHICYCLTPTRYLWSHEKEYFNNSYWLLIKGYVEFLKRWDFVTAQRPDKIISISETVRKRCLEYYNRDSEVVYPGFDEKYWQNIKDQISPLRSSSFEGQAKIKNYFLIVSRLEQYKKVDLVIKVFNKLNKPLIIVGEGTEEKKLKQMAGKNITFLSKLSDAELGNYYSNAEALVMPQEEDFGYVSLEAQFFNCPVIAYKKGGAVETVEDNKSGIFFDSQTEKSLEGAIERLDKIRYNLKNGILEFGNKNIEKFSKEKFIGDFQKNL